MSEREHESEKKVWGKDDVRDPPGGPTPDPVEPVAQNVEPPKRGGGDDQ
jgi:hypothetical protein